MPYETAADLTNKADLTEPEESIRKDIPSDYRLVSVLPDRGTYIERSVSSGDAWAELAKFTHENASPDWAEELANEITDDEYRIVYDWNHGSSGAWLLETRISEDE